MPVKQQIEQHTDILLLVDCLVALDRSDLGKKLQVICSAHSALYRGLLRRDPAAVGRRPTGRRRVCYHLRGGKSAHFDVLLELCEVDCALSICFQTRNMEQNIGSETLRLDLRVVRLLREVTLSTQQADDFRVHIFLEYGLFTFDLVSAVEQLHDRR